MSNLWQQTIDRQREQLLNRWLESGLALFSDRMAAQSPTGEALAQAMAMVLDHFLQGGEERREGIDRIARILAVHPAPPSRSLGLFAELAGLLRAEAPKGTPPGELDRLILALTLEAFDRFMEHREVIYKLKVDETRRSMHMLLRRAGS